MSFQFGTKRCGCHEPFHETKLIAITGGPGAGKTAVLEMATRAFCEHVAVLPESAGIVFGGGFPRLATKIGHETAQRSIFHIQRQMETLITAYSNVGMALCDRGTVDSSAYWPGPIDEFWEEMGTTRESQFERYEMVIHLRSPDKTQGYNHNNKLRLESASEAVERDERIFEAWTGHPNRKIVSTHDDFLAKAAEALTYIRAALDDCCATAPTT